MTVTYGPVTHVALYTDKPPEFEVEDEAEDLGYARKAVTWNSSSAGQVTTNQITFNGITSGGMITSGPWKGPATTWSWLNEVTYDKPNLIPLPDYSIPDGQYYEYWRLGYQHGAANRKRPPEYREHKDHFSFAFNQGYREGKEFLKMRKALGGS